MNHSVFLGMMFAVAMSTSGLAIGSDAKYGSTVDLAYVDTSVRKGDGIEELKNEVKFARIGVTVEKTGNKCAAWRGKLLRWDEGKKIITFNGSTFEIKTLTPVTETKSMIYECASLELPKEWR